MYHYGKSPMHRTTVDWSLRDDAHAVLARGSFPPMDIPVGNPIPIGRITAAPGFCEKHRPIHVSKSLFAIQVLQTTGIAGSTQLAYARTHLAHEPAASAHQPATALAKRHPATPIYGCTSLTDPRPACPAKRRQEFSQRRLVKSAKGKEVIMDFTPVFWNTSWFKMRPPHTLNLSSSTSRKPGL